MTDEPAKKAGFWRTLLTEDDANQVWCPVRVFGASGVGSYLVDVTYNLVAHAAFDAQAFGLGFAALIGAIGAGAGIKAKLGG